MKHFLLDYEHCYPCKLVSITTFEDMGDALEAYSECEREALAELSMRSSCSAPSPRMTCGRRTAATSTTSAKIWERALQRYKERLSAPV